MRKIKIIADSTCDLGQDLAKQYDIEIVPLYIVMDETSYKDGLEITPEEIYEWSDRNGKTPKTAAVGMDVALEYLKKFDEEDTDLIVFGISEELSSTCNVFRLVGEDLEHAKVHVIDSRNLSTGIGLQVLRAAELAAGGMGAEEIVTTIEQARDKVRASFVVETLTYLQRGGRCNAVTALVASALQLKPEITVQDGKMSVAKKYRGGIESVTLKYAKDLKEQLLKADSRRVFITHSGSDQKVIDSVYSFLKELDYFEEIHITRAGGVISSHCGPKTLGILFYEP